MSDPLPAAAATSRARFGLAARFALLFGASAGLALAAAAPPPPPTAWAATLILGAGALIWRHRLVALIAIALLAAIAGSVGGHLRLAALDSRALRGKPGAPLEGTGYLLELARPSPQGGFRFPLQLPGGRIEVESAGAPQASVGDRIYVSGTLAALERFDRSRLIADGIAVGLDADKAEPVPGGRAGLAGALDAVRRRAESALTRGTSETSASLLRGFVLGQDEGISGEVRDEFKRSGLAHILAVSGQNVVLLALLATPLLALLGVPLRLRFVLLIALIVIYVPVAGGGASIVRAGAMGVAGLVAAMASRPSSRWYALASAAAFTLMINPRYVADVGWQLSFAAVLGILLLARPLIEIFSPRATSPGPLRAALVEGAALTVSATIATAPLIAAHFETVSLTTLPANLLAAPAVAPAMWLGMSSAAIGQIPGAPVEPLGLLGGLCAGFIGWVAHLFGGEGAQLAVRGPGPLALGGLYLAAAVCAWVVIGSWRRRRLAVGGPSRSIARLAGRWPICAAALVAVLGVAALLGDGSEQTGPDRIPGLTVNFLDVGEGDSILLRTASGQSVLVDTGPPGSASSERLAELGVGRLTALLITHDQSDHDGALGSVIAGSGARRLIVAEDGVPGFCGRTACPPPLEVSQGRLLRFGATSVRVLWPPPAPAGGPSSATHAADPNVGSLVLLIRFRRFRLLLTGDAEQGFAPVHPGNLDVLKVAHHGSEDPGLGGLLDEATPSLAVISVGAGNPYGHPAPQALAELAGHGVEVARTDRDGEVEIDVFRRRWSVG